MEGMDSQLEAEILSAKNEALEDENSSLEEGEEKWSDWEEEEGTEGIYRSLFDEKEFGSFEACIEHDAKEYGFDIRERNQRLKLGFYGCVKLINYIRSRRVDRDSADEILSVFESEGQPWNDDKFLIPVMPEDALLTGLDFD
jgi:protein arginine N-methyltransferase 3